MIVGASTASAHRFGGDAPLQPGQEYLFFTSYDEEEGRYVIVTQLFGAVPVGDEEEHEKVEEFEQTEAAQVTPAPINR